LHDVWILIKRPSLYIFSQSKYLVIHLRLSILWRRLWEWYCLWRICRLACIWLNRKRRWLWKRLWDCTTTSCTIVPGRHEGALILLTIICIWLVLNRLVLYYANILHKNTRYLKTWLLLPWLAAWWGRHVWILGNELIWEHKLLLRRIKWRLITLSNVLIDELSCL